MNGQSNGQREKNKKGRAIGGMIVGVRQEMAMQQKENKTEEEGLMTEVVRAGDEEWTAIAAYVNGDMQKKMESISERVEEQSDKDRIIIGGDFNARTGTEGGRMRESEMDEEEVLYPQKLS